jgi:hypothetical protein
MTPNTIGMILLILGVLTLGIVGAIKVGEKIARMIDYDTIDRP